ncbi:MAG: PIN domain-containing protein [Deltaproteobacteria bacterium]|nr:PIN domain-containing protein [Deltaproteobacteria bacterium]
MTTDPDDNAFLECALESKADFLITGNIHHFPEKKFRNTSIVPPAEFVSHAAKLIR